MPDEHVTAAFELRHLRHLVALDAHGTLAAAAAALHTSQSALTKSIAALEELLGAPLFDRGGRRLAPNALHARVLARARAVLRAADDIAREAALTRAGHLDELHLGVGPVVALGRLPAALGRFRVAYPDVRVVIRVDATAALAPALVAGALHLVVSDYEQASLGGAAVHVEPLGADPLAVAVRRNHPLTRVRALTYAHLRDLPRGGATPPPRIARFVSEHLPAEVHEVTVRCDNYEVLVSLAETSDLLVFGPRSVLARYVAARRLRILPIDYPSPPSEPAVLTAAGRPLPPAVRALADLFLDGAADRARGATPSTVLTTSSRGRRSGGGRAQRT